MAAHGLDGHIEVEEVVDVPPYRALVDGNLVNFFTPAAIEKVAR